MSNANTLRSRFVRFGLAALALPLVATQQSTGQDALGGGNALDANPAQGSRFNPPAAQQNFRDRNLIITNNVLGGRGFRGSVGYSAEGDFRDALGSDDLFEFRAGSGWSSINYINYGSTYERLRYGQDLGSVEYRRSTYAPSPDEIRQGMFQGAGFDSGALVERRLRLDQLSSAVTAPVRTASAAEPVSLGYSFNEQGEMILINASALQGITAMPMSGDFQMLGLSSFDMARLREDAGEGRDVGQIGRRFEISYEDLLSGRLTPADGEEEDRPDLTITQDTRVSPQPLGSPMQLKQDVPQMGEILQRVAERYAQRREDVDDEDQQGLIRQLDRDMSDLRDQLRGQPPATEKQQPPATEKQQPPADFEEQPAPEGAKETDSREISRAKELGAVLRHGEEVRQLAPANEGRFNELVTSGEEYLRKGEWFRAERRFTRALRFAPEHPMATAGLAHAQIGGGLYLSAALTLRNLFTNQPEMIDTRYDEALVPNRPRLLAAVETLRQRLEQPNDRALYAFLLAYVGRLLEDRQIISDGVSAMEAAAEEDPLSPLLREIWLAEDEGQSGQAAPEK